MEQITQPQNGYRVRKVSTQDMALVDNQVWLAEEHDPVSIQGHTFQVGCDPNIPHNEIGINAKYRSKLRLMLGDHVIL
uniref:Uncharacterized protein n=1 Tax=Marseillevirus LCMAC201 TaxID=2506605 RepID=A0A481YY51_9VIRU|nr:MAG: hypothetical protein LCMAC201_03840 [Marseillevirus LCMAC201]